MPLERHSLEQTSMVRKFLCYSQMYKGKLHEKIFGVPNFRVLFVGDSPSRMRGMREVFCKYSHLLVRQEHFLFADWNSLKRCDDFLEASWMLPDGRVVRLLD